MQVNSQWLQAAGAHYCMMLQTALVWFVVVVVTRVVKRS